MKEAEIASTATGNSTGSRQRLDHVDAMRPVKQAAVIGSHSLIFFAPWATSAAVVGTLVLTRYSREAFLFVSACMLTYSYRDAPRVVMGHFWRRRAMAVALPYVTWTLIYFFYRTLRHRSHWPFFGFREHAVFSHAGFHLLVRSLVTGYYHLYYLLVILEFYAVFPVLLWLFRRWPQWHRRIFVVIVVYQVAFGVMFNAHYMPFQLSGFMMMRLIFSYPLYLVGGMYVAFHLEDFHRWVVGHWRIVLGATLAAAIFAEVLNYLSRYAWLPSALVPGSRPFSVSCLPFYVLAIAAVYLVGVYLVSPRRSLRVRAMVQSGADNAYGIYLSQMLWLPFLRQIGWRHLDSRIGWPAVAVLTVAVAFLAGLVFTAVVARTPLARAVAGRSREPWSTLWPRRHEVPAAIHDDTGEGPFDVVTE